MLSLGCAAVPKGFLISAWHTETAGQFFFEIKGLSAWANEYIIAPIERTGT
jgi:hypothetical protein